MGLQWSCSWLRAPTGTSTRSRTTASPYTQLMEPSCQRPQSIPPGSIPCTTHQGKSRFQFRLAKWLPTQRAPRGRTAHEPAQRTLPKAIFADEVAVLAGLPARYVLLLSANIADTLWHIQLLKLKRPSPTASSKSSRRSRSPSWPGRRCSRPGARPWLRSRPRT